MWGLLEAQLAPAAWTGQWGPAGSFPSPEWLQVSEGMVAGVGHRVGVSRAPPKTNQGHLPTQQGCP